MGVEEVRRQRPLLCLLLFQTCLPSATTGVEGLPSLSLQLRPGFLQGGNLQGSGAVLGQAAGGCFCLLKARCLGPCACLGPCGTFSRCLLMADREPMEKQRAHEGCEAGMEQEGWP